MTPSHLLPISFLMVALFRMMSGCVHTSTRHPAFSRYWSHRSPGNDLVTTTRLLPDSL